MKCEHRRGDAEGHGVRDRIVFRAETTDVARSCAPHDRREYRRPRPRRSRRTRPSVRRRWPSRSRRIQPRDSRSSEAAAGAPQTHPIRIDPYAVSTTSATLLTFGLFDHHRARPPFVLCQLDEVARTASGERTTQRGVGKAAPRRIRTGLRTSGRC